MTQTTHNRTWIRLIPPGVSHEKYRIASQLQSLLAQPIRGLFQVSSGLVAFDVVSFAGEQWQELCLAPRIDSDTRPRTVAGQITTQSSSNVHESVTVAVADRLAEQFPDMFGLELVRLDLSPLGTTPVPVERLVGRSFRQSSFNRSPLTTSIQQLTAADEPHLIHLCITNIDASTYEVEMRVGMFGTRRSSGTADTPAAHDDRNDTALSTPAVVAIVRNNLGYDLSQVCKQTPTTTNFELFRKSHWTLHRPATAPREQDLLTLNTRRLPESAEAEAKAAWQVAMTDYEYERLRGLKKHRYPLRRAYRQLDVRPTVRIPASSLREFFAYHPNYDLGRIGDWNHPTLTRQATIQQATATEH